MIVPDFWAEARRQHRDGRKQVTVRRFGWSTASESEALAMAETRAAEALRRILAGEKLDRRERKTAYNGAHGVPIREEVLERHGDEVITRNSYGAHCLNTPRALFADIDFEAETGIRPILAVLATFAALSLLAGFQTGRWGLAIVLLFCSLLGAAPVATRLQRLRTALRG